jgi:hypothetical protein
LVTEGVRRQGLELAAGRPQFRWVADGFGVPNKNGVADFPVLPGIDGHPIFGEHDEKQQSMKAIQACAERWLAAGREVLTAWPMAGNDLNDELLRRHVHCA